MLMALVLSIGLISCDEQKQNEDITPQEQLNQQSRLAGINTRALNTSNIDEWQGVDRSELSQSIQDYLNNNYPGVEIEELWLTETGEYIILLENDMVVIFNASGELIIAFDLGEILEGGDFDDDEWDWEDIDPADLPQGILDYIATNYPDATIEEAGKDPETGEYIIVLDNGLCVIFDADGNFVEEIEEDDFDDESWEELATSDLPQSVLDYLAANYPDANIEEAFKDTETGEFIVVLDNGLCVIFDADGNFVEEIEEDDFDDEDFDDEDWSEIDSASLPQAILDYIATNYAGASIDEAAKNDETGEYAVYLDSDVLLLFDADGNFVEAYEEDEFEDCTELAIADLPAAITDYIAANYSDNTIVEAYYSEEDEEYYIVLDNDKVLIFDKDGNFLEEEDD